MTEQGPSSDAPRPQPSVPPPTQAGPLPSAQVQGRSTWPVIVGILAIVLGIWAILGAGMQALQLLLASRGMMPSQPTPMPQGYATVSGVITLVMSVLALACGIGLIRRRRWAFRGLTAWAILTVLSMVVNGTVMMPYLPQFLAEMEQQTATAGGGPPPGLIRILVVPMMCFGLLIGLAPRVFVLIWFSRPTVKAEVAGWA